MSTTTIRVGIADDEGLFRKGLISLLEDETDLTFTLEAADGAQLLEQLATADPLPHVLLLDLKMPNLNGIDAAKQLRDDYPDLRIIVLSTYYSDAFILNMIEIGAASYLPKNTEPDEVARIIRDVHRNEFSYTPDILRVIHQKMRKKKKPKPVRSFNVSLTRREREILQLICDEYTTQEIADRLYLSPRTIEGHRNNLLTKLNVKNTVGLVVAAIQLDLVSVNPERFGFG